ncbi:MAG: hypothetical protein ACFN39_02410, partial [Lacticaseibacillus rhamnosus]
GVIIDAHATKCNQKIEVSTFSWASWAYRDDFPVNFGMIPDSTCSMKVTRSSTLVGNLIREAGLFLSSYLWIYYVDLSPYR